MRLAPIAALCLLALLAPSTAAETPAPSWTVGDTWEYAGWRLSEDGAFLDVAERLVVAGRTELGAGPDAAYRVQRVATVVEGNETVELLFANMFYRVSDLSLLGEDLEVAGVDYQVDVNVVYTPPARLYAFPLTVGRRWAAGSEASMSTSDISTVVWTDPSATQFEVAASEDLRIPIVEAGRFSPRTFHTTVVLSTLGPSTTRSYYAAEVGQFVRRESFESGEPVGVIELTSYAYAETAAPEFPLLPVLAASVSIPAVALLAARRRISRRTRRAKREP